MSRFYKTTAPTFVDDIIYQAPHEIMAQALQAQDRHIDEMQEPLEGTEALYKDLQATPQDEMHRSQEIKKLNDTILDLTEKVRKNPALSGRLQGEINQTRRDLEESVNSGALYKMDKASKNREKLRADLKAQYDRGMLREDAYEAALKTADKEYTGYSGGSYMETIDVLQKVDESAIIANLKSTISENSSAWSNSKPNGEGYIVTKGGQRSILDPERVENALVTDPKFLDWEREQQQTINRQLNLGMFEDDEDSTAEEKAIAEFENRRANLIANTLEKLPYDRRSDTTALSADSVQLQSWGGGPGGPGEYLVENREIKFDSVPTEFLETAINDLGQMTRSQQLGAIANLMANRDVIERGMSARNMNMEDFKDQLETMEGRLALAQSFKMTTDELLQVANYEKEVNYKTITAPVTVPGSQPTARQNIEYAKKVQTAFQEIPAGAKVRVRLIDERGNITEEFNDIRISEAISDGYIPAPTAEVASTELVPATMPGTGAPGFMGKNGRIITMPDPAGKDLPHIPAPTQELAMKYGKPEIVKSKTTAFDPDKPFFNVTADQIRQTNKRIYSKGSVPVKKQELYNIQLKKEENGKLLTISIDTPLDIK